MEQWWARTKCPLAFVPLPFGLNFFNLLTVFHKLACPGPDPTRSIENCLAVTSVPRDMMWHDLDSPTFENRIASVSQKFPRFTASCRFWIFGMLFFRLDVFLVIWKLGHRGDCVWNLTSTGLQCPTPPSVYTLVERFSLHTQHVVSNLHVWWAQGLLFGLAH